MKTINKLALNRVRHNRSTSILTVIALVLTTTLLMTLATGVLGMMDANKRFLKDGDGNYHASFDLENIEQAKVLERHMDIESLHVREYAASLSQDKITANLIYHNPIREGIRFPGLTEGTYPTGEYEIAGPPAFFERLGVEPVVGGTVAFSYRIRGESEILTDTFTITGLYEQIDTSVLDISETRLAYAAFISEALADKWAEDYQRNAVAYLRVYGEDTLSYSEISDIIYSIAANNGIPTEFVALNDGYLTWVVGMDTEMLFGAIFIAALIVVFCVLILYSIYYVSVITNIQELGKIRALGGSKRQMRQLMLREGLFLSAVSIPIGLVLGYCLAYFGLSSLLGQLIKEQGMSVASMFSLPITLVVVAVVLGTVLLSLLRPMQVAAKVSPMEAIRYQEESTGKQANRKGRDTVTLPGLSIANITRNRGRSVVTVLTLSMGCVLFIVVSSVLAGVRAEDLARRAIPKGDFVLEYKYALDDETYPENNLEQIQLDNPLDSNMTAAIEALPGVTKVEHRLELKAEIDHPAFNTEHSQIVVTVIDREDFQALAPDWKQGDMDYDTLVNQNGFVYNWDSFFDYFEFELDKTYDFQFYVGEDIIPQQATLLGTSATSPLGNDFLMPIENIGPFLGDTDLTNALYIHVEDSAYESVKAALMSICEEDIRFRLYSMDEEMSFALYSMQMVLLICYAFLVILGVISFINLVNTMITSIVTRRRELGLLQPVGLSDRQMVRMLSVEGFLFTGGALTIALTLGSVLGYWLFLWAKNVGFLSIRIYSYPVVEAVVMVAALLIGQALITYFTSRYVLKDSVIERIAL